MSDHADPERRNDTPEAPAPGPDGLESLEAYETADGVVFYDADNPLAWLKSSAAEAIDDRR